MLHLCYRSQLDNTRTSQTNIPPNPTKQPKRKKNMCHHYLGLSFFSPNQTLQEPVSIPVRSIILIDQQDSVRIESSPVRSINLLVQLDNARTSVITTQTYRLPCPTRHCKNKCHHQSGLLSSLTNLTLQEKVS